MAFDGTRKALKRLANTNPIDLGASHIVSNLKMKATEVSLFSSEV